MKAFSIDLERDAAAVRDMAAQLDPYLYQDDLYGSLRHGRPRLTVGGLLLRLHRLHSLRSELTPTQADALVQAEADLDQARADWAIHYAQKIRRELHARQNSLAWYLDDCDDTPKTCASAYPVEAEKRTIIHHLLIEGTAHGLDLAEETTRQATLDGRLRRHFSADDFIWPADVQPAYPPDPFWWLYGRPVQET